jgi:hypothetical protein
MDGLENTKVPRLGSAGEHYRSLQLVVQLPRQDLSADHCRQLKLPASISAFEDFCKLRETKMDVAHVRQCKDGKTVRTFCLLNGKTVHLNAFFIKDCLDSLS